MSGRYHPYGGGSAGPSGSNAYASGSGSYDYGYGTGANGSSGGGGGSSYGYGGVGAGPSNVPAWDPDIAQQSSIYTPEAAERGNYKQHRENASGKKGGQGGGGGKSRTTVLRKGAGELWEDPTLLEWDPKHFRLFVGNLDPALSDDTFQQAFAKYPSLVKAKIVRDKNSKKCKGYGFVAYSDPEDFLKAWKELNGKYVGTRPVTIKKAETGVQAVNIGDRKARDLEKRQKEGSRFVDRSRASAQAAGAKREPGRSYIRR